MNLDSIYFKDVSVEQRGVLVPGDLIFQNQGLVFKNSKTGKNLTIQSRDWDRVLWVRMAGGFGLKFFLKSDQFHRFCGFKEPDFKKIGTFFESSYQIELKEEEKSIKGWNWGSIKFNGNVLGFSVDRQTCFDLPLNYVSQCTTGKNEAVLEFQPNEEASVALTEMRFYIPQEGAEGDPLETFHQKVLEKADILQATGDALLSLNEVPSLTPRGRYDLKIYPSFLQLHGKTFDYKIQYSAILRIFILPHPDGRQMFFVLSLDPPIKQGQTRYPFLILNFKKDEDPIEAELEIGEKELKEKYDGRLEKHVSGQTYEVLGRVLKGLVNRKITVPGSFKGSTGSSLSCSYKAASGFLYPLDRAFVFVHKPAIHVRFDEISAVNFARSGGNTRSFDFELETRNGQSHTFNGLAKEEYSRLYDFVTERRLRVKNSGDKDDAARSKTLDVILDSDDEDAHDPYMERVKNEGMERDEDEEDEDFKPAEDGSDVAEEFDSDAGNSSDEDGSGGDEDKPKKDKEKKEKKKSSSRYADEVGNDNGERKKKRKAKEGKKEKDPDMPKRPLSAYMIWLQENREQIKTDNPGISMIDISKKGGELWKKITDHKKWEEKAAEAKRQYDIQMKEYEKNRKERDDATDRANASKHAKKDSKKGKSSASTSSPLKIKSDEFVATDDDTSSSEDDKASKSKKRSKTPQSSASEIELSD